MKESITIDFLEKVVIANSVSLYQHLRQNSPHISNDPHMIQGQPIHQFGEACYNAANKAET